MTSPNTPSRVEEIVDDLVDNQLPEQIISVSSAKYAKEILIKAFTALEAEKERALDEQRVAIMAAAHDVEIRDDSQYPKIRTHDLATILGGKYHEKLEAIKRRAGEAERKRIYKDARRFANNLGTIEMCEEYDEFLQALTPKQTN